MLMVNVVAVADCPTLGINVYVVDAVLLIAGDHEPLTPFNEVLGNAAMISPLQNGPTWVKSGATMEETFTPNERTTDQLLVSAA